MQGKTKPQGCRPYLILAVAVVALATSCGGGGGNTPGPNITSATLLLNNSSLDFGSVAVGNSKSDSITLTNSSASGGPSLTISQISTTGSAFSTLAPNLPLVLAAGQSSTLTITFSPTVAGVATGSLSITVEGSNQPATVPLTGSGLAPGQLAVSPSTLSFGNVNVGSSSNKTGTLTAGSTAITVSSAAWNGQGYSVSGITFPVTIASTQSVTFTATFAPQVAGSSNGGVSFVSDASNSPTNQAFTGTGVQPVQHSASLSWDASASQVIGYYIYRSTHSGSYTTPLNQTPQIALTYTDTAVNSGVTYYYVVTAVDSNSQQSNYSNEVTAVIP